MTIEEIKAELAKRLKPSRYEHSLGVAKAAVKLAGRFGIDQDKAELAGLLHDCAREFPQENLIDEAYHRGVTVSPIEQAIPFMLHAPVGASRAKELYGITDRDVLEAIARHTVGGKGMSELDKIIYYADMIEENRDYPGVEEMRQLAETASLDEMLLAGFDQTLSFVLTKHGLMHPDTVVARNEVIMRLM